MTPSQTMQDLRVEEARKVFGAAREPIDRLMDKKLIINVTVPGSFVDRGHNPNLPVTTEEVARQVADARNAGAAMWHLHPRDPESDTIFMPLEKRLKIHEDWCDAVFAVAPDIITDVGAIYVRPPTIVEGLVDEKSILAETRAAPLIDAVTKFGPGNRYVEVAIVLIYAAALGGTNAISLNNRAGVISDVKFLQSRGIRVELSPFNHSDLRDAREWVVDSGIAQPPVIMDTLIGLHNSPTPNPGMDSFELLFTFVRMLPKGVLWQALSGGRYWLPLTTAAICLGADIVRVGMEDAVYMYPHSKDYIKGCGQVVEAVAGIARHLGREVATPGEARKILGLPQLSR